MSVARRGRPALVLLALAASAPLAACDSEPGLPPEAARPTIESVRVTPVRDSLATAAPTAEIPLAVEAELGGEGPITVRVLVRYAETDSVVAEAVAVAEPGPVRVEAPLVLPRGATGDYEVDVTTEGPGGRLGDRAAAVFRFAAASLGPPSVTVESVSVELDRRGVPVLSVTATATDPDGLANVIAVGIRDAGAEGGVGFRLSDRGPDQGSGADEVAGDGRFTEDLEVLGIPSGTEIALEVVAFDRAGTVSEPAPFTITVP